MATKPNFSGRLGRPLGRGNPGLAGSVRIVPPSAAAQAQLSYWDSRVREFPLFLGITPEERASILSGAQVRLISRGQTIYVEGDRIRQVILLTYGSAKMTQSGEDGATVILRLCGPGELVGTLGITMQEKIRATSQALTPCSALIWNSECFESLSRQFPSLRLNVAYLLYKLLEEMEGRFRELSTECVSTRLGRQVLRLVEQVGVPSNGAVEIQMTREELAQLIGTSLFTVSRLLSKWDRKGIVKTRREGFSVKNVGALEDLVNEYGGDE
jgi:CRP/FNR family transcriptional regulator, nitrogen oxide reductase regulator